MKGSLFNRQAARTVRRGRRWAALVAAAGAVAAGSYGPALAGTYNWANTSGNWSDPNQWGGTVPASDPSTVLNFGTGASAYTSNFDLGTGFQLNQLNLAIAAGQADAITTTPLTNTLNFVANGAAGSSSTDPQINMTGGGTFRIANNITIGSGSNLTLNVDPSSYLVFAAAATPNGSTNQSISAASGSASYTVTGGGTVVARTTGANTNVNVTNGLLTTDGDGDFFSSTTTLNVGANGTVDTGGFGEGWASITGSAGGVFRGSVSVSAASGTFEYDGIITDRPGPYTVPGFGSIGNAASKGGISKSGGHTLLVTGASTFTGNTTLTGGTLVYAGNPVTSATSPGGGYPNGTITSSPFGTATLTLGGGGTLSIDAGQTRTIANPITVTAATSNTVSIPGGSQLVTSGIVTFSGTVTKTGDGTWLYGGGNGSANAASVLNVNGGTFLLSDINNGGSNGGDLNATTINVNSGGTFQFGSSPAFSGENPDLPNSTYINVNTGGTVAWNIGEDYGGFNLLGGSVGMKGNINLQGVTASEWQSGTVSATGGSPAFGGAQVINKDTTGTVTITGVALNNTGGLNIQNGTLATDSAIASTSGGNPITAPITFGTSTTSGTLEYTGSSTAASLSRAVTINAGGGTLQVDNAAAVFTYGGSASGSGALTKAGPGTLVLTGAGSWTGGTNVTGGTLQVGASAAAGSLSGGVVVSSGATLAFNRPDAVTFAGNVSGAGGLSQLGSGSLTLTGASTYSGPTNVAAGLLRVPTATANLAGPVTVADGATLAMANPSGSAVTLNVPSLTFGTSGSTLQFELNQTGNPTTPLLNVTTPDGLVTNGGTETLSVLNQQALAVGTVPLIQYAGAPITSGFSLSSLPARTLGNLVYDTTNDRISLQVTAVDSIHWTGAVDNNWDVGSDVNQGGTMNFRLTSNSAATNFITNDTVFFDDTATGPGGTNVNLTTTIQPSSVTLNNSAKDYTFSGPGSLAGSMSLTKQGTGNLTILTANSYAGGTTVSGGTLNIGNGGTTGDVGFGPLAVNSGGAVVWNRTDGVQFGYPVTNNGSLTNAGGNTLDLTAAFTGTGTTTLTGGGLQLDSSADYTYAGRITGTGSLTKSSAGTVTLSGNNDYSGGTTVAGGTLQIGAGGTSGAITGDVTVVGTDQANGTLVFNRSDNYTYSGNINSSGRIVNAGTGNTTLAGAITQDAIFPGTITAQTGTLTLANPNTSGLLGNITANTGATVALNTTSGDQTYSNVFTGQGTILKVGTGTVTMTASNTFTGTLQINAGTFVLADPGAGSGTSGDINATSIVVNSGGTFQFGQGGVTGENPDLPDTTFITVNPGGNVDWRVGEQIGGINIQGGTVTLDGGGITDNGTSASWTSGTLTTSGSTAYAVGGGAVIVKTTPGVVTVSGAATISSVLNIQEGTVAFASAANLGSAAVQLGASGATPTTGIFEYEGATPAAARAGAFTLNGAGDVRVDLASTALTLSGVMSGSGSLIKDGPGALILTGVNTFSGGTSVNAGTLLINGQTGSSSGTGTGPVTVTSSGGSPAVLAGTGSIAGAATLANFGARLAPGGLSADGTTSLIGALTIGKTVTFNPGSTFEVQVGDASGNATPAAGTDYDQLVVKGSGTSVSISDGSVLSVLLASPVTVGQSFVVLDNTGTGALTGTFRDPSGNVLGEGGVLSAGGQNFLVSYANNDVTLTATSAPEPAAAGLLAAAAAGGLLRRRRRAGR